MKSMSNIHSFMKDPVNDILTQCLSSVRDPTGANVQTIKSVELLVHQLGISQCLSAVQQGLLQTHAVDGKGSRKLEGEPGSAWRKR